MVIRESEGRALNPTQPISSAVSIPRRHDLDALRAIAMLLGIALHAALSFMPLPDAGWSVHDVRQSDWFGVFNTVIHGFRMPLFFLISGFFTAMLWRKRGLGSLLLQRLKRIVLPLVIGTFTIVPAVWIVSIAAGITAVQPISDGEHGNLWAAAAEGDVEQAKSFLSADADPGAVDPKFGVTPLSAAARGGHLEVVELLIASGLDVNVRDRDGMTPLHSAAFFGRADTARVLVQNGADLEARNRLGETPAAILETGWSRILVAGAFGGFEVDRERLVAGRKEVAEVLQQRDQTASSPAEGAATAQIDISQQEANLSGVLLLLMMFPAFHHLWFLWFLCWLVAAFAVYAMLAQRLNWKAPPWIVVSPLRYAWLIPLTCVVQSTMGLFYPSFGPDTSTGLLPMPQILVYYAIFFFFGAMYFDCEDASDRLGRRWRLTIPIALLVVFPVGYDMTVGGFGFTDGWIDSRWYRPLAVALQVVYVWLMSFGLIGLFRSLFSRESRAMRYVSDSSYWLYLTHLPLIIVAQAVVRSWQIPALVKFALVCSVCSALLLVSYQLLVRYSPIGTLLNGPRKRPQRVVDAALVEPVSPSAALHCSPEYVGETDAGLH
jgi:peptidoglycan/LPS O-acetylase OafA/YrhL